MIYIKKNTIKVEVDNKQIELYLSNIDTYIDEYINSLPDETIVYKSNGFMGLLLYIYDHCIKDIIKDYYYNNYDTLNILFDRCYLPLCYRFNISPTVIGFCSFVNIDNTNVSDIKNGRFRNGYKVNNVKATQTVKHWYSVCESALLYKAVNESSIGSIFALKSGYGYNDNPKQQIEVVNNGPVKSIDQLELEYADFKPIAAPNMDEYLQDD